MSTFAIQWTAISALVGFGVLFTTLLLHIIKYSMNHGATQERIKRLEQEMIAQKDVKETVSDLKGVVNALTATVHEMRGFFNDMIRNNIKEHNK